MSHAYVQLNRSQLSSLSRLSNFPLQAEEKKHLQKMMYPILRCDQTINEEREREKYVQKSLNCLWSPLSLPIALLLH